MKETRFSDWSKDTVKLTKRDQRGSSSKLLEPWKGKRTQQGEWTGTKKATK